MVFGTAGWWISNDAKERIVADARFIASSGQILTIGATWVGHMGREHIQAIASATISSTLVSVLQCAAFVQAEGARLNWGRYLRSAAMVL